MRLLLVRTDFDPARCLEGYEYAVHRISEKREGSPPGVGGGPGWQFKDTNWHDYDVFLTDTALFDGHDIWFSVELANRLARPIRGGAVAVVFCGALRAGRVLTDLVRLGDDDPLGARSLEHLAKAIIGPREPEDNYVWIAKLLGLTRAKGGQELARGRGPDLFTVLPSGAASTSFEPGASETFNAIVSRYREGVSWHCSFRLPMWGGIGPFNGSFEDTDPEHEVLLSNKAREPIAIHWYGGRLGKGHLVLLPDVRPRDAFLRDFLDQFLSQVCPHKDFTRGEKPPDWVMERPVALPAQLLSDIEGCERRLAGIKDVLTSLEERRRAIERYQRDMLWQTGEERLREAVRWAFGVLGLQCAVEEPIDLVGQYADTPVVVEVQGTTGSVQVGKVRQLTEWTSRRRGAKGILVGNPFRLRPLDDRPPGGHKLLFTKEAEEEAASKGFSLVLSWELAEAAGRVLSGKRLDGAKFLRQIMEGSGIVRLP